MKQLKLIAFDLDGTLCPHGHSITQENLARLHELERRGVQIAICSGKPTYYLCGFLRQAGLKEPILVGENGAVIQFGIKLPPKRFYIQPYSQKAKEGIELLRKKLTQEMPQLWYQPNLVGLTPFAANREDYEHIRRIWEENQDKIQDIHCYPQNACFDFVPFGLNKFGGMKRLGELLGISPEETVAVGNDVNDYPMFEYAGYSMGINLPEPDRADVNFSTVDEALELLLTMLSSD